MSRRVDMTSFLCSLCGTSQIEMLVLNFRSCFLGKFYLKSFTYQYPHLLNQLINTQSWILSWAGSLMSKLIVLQTKYPVLMISVAWSILVVHLSPELLLSGALTCLPQDPHDSWPGPSLTAPGSTVSSVLWDSSCVN